MKRHRHAVIAGAGGDDAALGFSAVSVRRRLSAPRSLNEPVICKLSSLKNTRLPVMRLIVSEYGKARDRFVL